jgi:RNA polymerase sigma-70 factor (ECF subfamily)
MNTTPPSLLARLRQPSQQEAWTRFVKLYTPLMHYWTRRLGLPADEAADLIQEVLVVLVQKLPEFSYDQKKSFRSWLHMVMLNKWRNRCRRRAALPGGRSLPHDPPDVAGPDTTLELDEAEYRHHLVKQAFHLMQAEFPPVTWKACWEYMVAERAAPDVAAELGIAVSAVYLAKSRGLGRLRRELEGLMD